MFRTLWQTNYISLTIIHFRPKNISKKSKIKNKHFNIWAVIFQKEKTTFYSQEVIWKEINENMKNILKKKKRNLNVKIKVIVANKEIKTFLMFQFIDLYY